jgi:putative tricarboxylic transport membrane protein
MLHFSLGGEEETLVKIKSPKDFWAGLMFVVSACFFLVWARSPTQMGTAVRMGPAYFPAVLGGLLAALRRHRPARLVRHRRPAGSGNEHAVRCC